MIIRKKRIQSVGKNIRGITRGDHLVVGLTNLHRFANALIKVGFSAGLGVGETLLPAALGPISTFNAEGDYEIHKDQPMETAYRQAEWKWKEFRGRYDTVERSKIVGIPYKRYPRTFIPPPSVELSIKQLQTGDMVLASQTIEFIENRDAELIHIINLFLELFGECELLRQDLSPVLETRLVRLNWEVLPKGLLPWVQLQKHLKPIVERQPDGNRAVINKRHEAINAFGPEFVAVGHGGFDGYVIFGFPSKSIYILESTQINNATYVLDKNWEDLSNMTKAELLNHGLQKERLIHRENWFAALRRVLS